MGALGLCDLDKPFSCDLVYLSVKWAHALNVLPYPFLTD